MSNFNYEESQKQIEEILNSKNGVRTWVGAMFIDIRNSTDYFKENDAEKVARIIRAFTSETIGILKQNEKYVQIGIRGDCVYAIYSTPKEDDLNNILTDACFINTFQIMFQKILKRKGWPTFEIGIGLGASKDLVIKAGKKGTGINDNIWIGDAVIDASKLSNEGNTNGIDSIVMDSCFYESIKDFDANDKFRNSHYISRVQSKKLNEYVYCSDMIIEDFYNWIKDRFGY